MRDYQKGKIYKVVCESGLIYIGSTVRELKDRLYEHTKNGNGCRTKNFINPTIQLIENYPCNNIIELETRERHYMENFNECVNRNVPTRTRKEYYEENKEILLEKNKEYYEKNKEKILERNKKYSKTLDRKEYYKQWRKNQKPK